MERKVEREHATENYDPVDVVVAAEPGWRRLGWRWRSPATGEFARARVLILSAIQHFGHYGLLNVSSIYVTQQFTGNVYLPI
jgi:hypothetical protein